MLYCDFSYFKSLGLLSFQPVFLIHKKKNTGVVMLQLQTLLEKAIN